MIGPVTLPPQELVIVPALISVRWLMIAPELLMALFARFEAVPEIMMMPPVWLFKSPVRDW